MRRIVYKLVIILLILVGIDFTWGLFFDNQLNTIKDGDLAFVKHTLYDTDDDIIIVGSSRAESNFVTKDLEKRLRVSAWNAGKNGQIIPYWFAVSGTILERHTPKLLILNLNPLSLTEDPNFNAYQRASGILRPFYGLSNSIDSVVSLSTKHEDLFLKSNLYKYNSTYLSFLPFFGNNKLKMTNKGWKTRKSALKNTGTQKKSYWYGRVNEESLNLFKGILSRAKEKNVPVIVVMAPTYKTDIENSGVINQLNELGGFYMLDYSNHPIRNNAEYFKDRTHLNVKGAKEFTRLLAKDISALGIL